MERNRVCSIDIETNNLLAPSIDYTSLPYKLKPEAKLWCIVITDVQTLKAVVLTGSEITKERLEKELLPYSTVVSHNGFKFDLVYLMLMGLLEYKIGYLGERDLLFGREVRFIDTMIMSRLINPDRQHGHSLASWGNRVGRNKMDYRGNLIELGVIEKSLPKGDEFKFYHDLMPEYCVEDTIVTALTYLELLNEYKGYNGWKLALQQEHKLADIAIRRETFGFAFDKELALKNIEELTSIMDDIKNRVNPILPRKPLTKTELSNITPPNNQYKKDGTFTSHMLNFFKRNDITNYSERQKYFIHNGNIFELPSSQPLYDSKDATVDDLDVVKGYLLSLGWKPSEWAERDIMRDSKKQIVPLDKRIKSVERYVAETLSGKYKEHRLKELGLKEDNMLSKLLGRIRDTKSVKVPTAPKIRVGVTKDMCPKLIELGDEVSFAKDVADYYTYRHRKSAIAGGDIEDMDFDEEVPNTGYLASYREEDGRISTPAIEIGASTNRYKHIGVANVPRLTSLFGKQMRGLFGAGKDYIQFGFDYASLEARIEGNYVFDYEGGEELAIQLLAEKPNDIHTVTAGKLGIDRDSAKSTNYAIIYGASANKFVKMLGYTLDKAKQFYADWWEANPSLKALKEDKEQEWIRTGKKTIKSIDGRLINIRSQHSILNALFQSAGVICAKYITVLMFKKFEEMGYCWDVFKGVPDIAPMIEYHDENQLAVKKELFSFKKFKTKEEAEEYTGTGKQLGAIQKGNDCYYITESNPVSELITETIKEVEELFKMKVSLGYEYVTGRNWSDCH